MSILDSVKDKLKFGKSDRWDDDYEDDFYDDYAERSDAYPEDGEGYGRNGYADAYDGDGYDDDYDDYRYRQEGTLSEDGVASWPEQLDGNPRRENRLGEMTPLVTNSDVRSKSYGYLHRGDQARSASRPDYESSLQQYDIKPRNRLGRASGHSEESLTAARAELEALQRGEDVPLDSLNSPAYGAATDGRRGSYSTSAVSRRIVTVVPESYEDAAKVSEAFRNGSSAVVSLVRLRPDLARRFLDFSFGVVSVSDGTVEKVGDRVFFLARGGVALSEAERQQLRDAGIL